MKGTNGGPRRKVVELRRGITSGANYRGGWFHLLSCGHLLSVVQPTNPHAKNRQCIKCGRGEGFNDAEEYIKVQQLLKGSDNARSN